MADLVEFLYAQATSTVAEIAGLARYPKRNPYKSKHESGIVYCGGHPMLTARRVTDLQVELDEETQFEVITWTLLPRYRSTEAGPSLVGGPVRQEFVRRHAGPISNELIWDRGIGDYKTEWKGNVERAHGARRITSD